MANIGNKLSDLFGSMLLIMIGLGLALPIQDYGASIAADNNTSTIAAVFYGMLGWIWALVIISLGAGLVIRTFKSS